MQRSHLLSFRVAVEVVWPHVFAKHDIIIEVNELLGEPWDAVDVGLNGRRAERGKVAVVLEDILEDKVKQMYLTKSKHFLFTRVVRSFTKMKDGKNYVVRKKFCYCFCVFLFGF